MSIILHDNLKWYFSVTELVMFILLLLNILKYVHLFPTSHEISSTKIKSEDGFGVAQCTSDWATYRFHQSTFEQIKQSVKKAKAALQDRNTFLASSAFRYFYHPPPTPQIMWIFLYDKSYKTKTRSSQQKYYFQSKKNRSLFLNYSVGFALFFLRCSEIYSTPRLSDTLENGVSLGSSCLVNAANNIGHINSNSFTTSNVTSSSSNINSIQLQQQKHRIDALAHISAAGSSALAATNILSTTSTTATPSSMDTVVDSKSRQGSFKFLLYFVANGCPIHFIRTNRWKKRFVSWEDTTNEKESAVSLRFDSEHFFEWILSIFHFNISLVIVRYYKKRKENTAIFCLL